MTTAGWDFGSLQDSDLLSRAQSQLDIVVRTLRVATVLTKSGRPVDLSGLEIQVGRLCAQTMDLGWHAARGLRPQLAGLLTELNQLASLQRLT